MATPLNNHGLEWDKPRARHWVAAPVAVVLSLVLHGVALYQAPSMALGRVPGFEESVRIRPVVLGDVRRELAESGARPERFSPQQPGVMAPESLASEAFREVVEALLPSEPADMGVALTGEDRAVVTPSPETGRALWDARSDIVQIRDRVVPDEISALPRRLVPDIDRSVDAPDISLPVEVPADALAMRGEGWLQASAASARADVGGGRGPRTGATTTGFGEMDMPMQPVDILEESADQITDVAPIENLLALDLVTYRDPSEPDQVFFRVRITRSGAEALPVLPKDVYLIQDASASMSQRAIDQCKIGLHHWLEQLNAEDRLDVIAFRDNIYRVFGELTPVTPVTRSQAAFFIESLRARGGTDVFASLEALLGMEVTPGRPTIAVMVSDGVPTTGVVDSTEIIARFSQANAGRMSVFNVGGGPRVNMYMLDFLSYKNRGDAKMTERREEIPDALERLARELSRPVLANLQWRLAGERRVEMYPAMLTHLYLDRPLVVYGRAHVDEQEAVIRIQGRSGEDDMDMVFRLDFPQAGVGGSYIRTEWAWQKIYSLVGEHIRTRSVETLTEIRQLAAAYNLPVLYGTDRVPMGFDRSYHFHGSRVQQYQGDR